MADGSLLQGRRRTGRWPDYVKRESGVTPDGAIRGLLYQMRSIRDHSGSFWSIESSVAIKQGRCPDCGEPVTQETSRDHWLKCKKQPTKKPGA